VVLRYVNQLAVLSPDKDSKVVMLCIMFTSVNVFYTIVICRISPSLWWSLIMAGRFVQHTREQNEFNS
jgi:hypothetical protein